MNVLVTGGAGFIGSWIAGALCDLGHAVHIIDDLSGGTPDNIPEAADASLFDLRDAAKTQETFERVRPNIVYHLACHPHEGLSQFRPLDIASSVLDASLSVFRASITCGSVKRVVNFSSMARYGDCAGKQPPYAEHMGCTPRDVYGAAKLAAEHSLAALSEAHGLDYVTLVPHNVVGPRQCLADPYRNVIAIWTNRLMHGKPPLIYGDGKQRRAFSDVRDSVDCYLKAGLEGVEDVKADGPYTRLGYKVINIGGADVLTINEAAHMVLEAFGSDLEPVHVEGRPCEVLNAYCTIEKSERLLGFKQSQPVRYSIKDFVEWAKTQGPQECRYLPREEIEITRNLPPVWRDEEM